MRCDVEVNGRVRQVHLRRVERGFEATIGTRTWTVDAARIDGRTWSLLLSGGEGGTVTSHEVALVPDRTPGRLLAHVGSASISVALNGRRRRGSGDRGGAGASGPVRLVAPMPGKVVRIVAPPGTAVSARQAVVVIEAMKMENELRAGCDGVVSAVPVSPGQSVEAGALVAVVTPGGGT